MCLNELAPYPALLFLFFLPWHCRLNNTLSSVCPEKEGGTPESEGGGVNLVVESVKG